MKYNGISLPDLPEYDTAAYPYACIQRIPYAAGGCIAHLRYSSKPFVAAGGAVTNSDGAGFVLRSYLSASSNFLWNKPTTIWNVGLSLPPDTVIWCNQDILDEDGGVLLSATEPAGEPTLAIPNFCLSSWLVGFALGLAGRPLPTNSEWR